MISMGDPGDVQLFPNADAILAAVYDPADAITVAFGFYGAFGRLPANIYAYDPVTDSYNTKKVVYPKDFGIEYDPITAMNETAITIEFYQAEYSGSEIRPSIFVKAEITHSDGRHTKVLTEGKDYFVTYSNNIEVGTATVTATGMGCCIGSNSAHFEIFPRQDPPLTGDGASPALWTVLLSASLLIAIPLLRKHRRNGRR